MTLATAGLALFARPGGYRDQVSASTLREVAAPIYYNLTLFAPTNNAAGTAARGQRLRRELTEYLRDARHRDARRRKWQRHRRRHQRPVARSGALRRTTTT